MKHKSQSYIQYMYNMIIIQLCIPEIFTVTTEREFNKTIGEIRAEIAMILEKEKYTMYIYCLHVGVSSIVK